MAEPISIRKIITKVESGEIRIPAFQRNYVWTSEQVAFLLDSIYKGIPIGSVFLWKSSEKLKFEKHFGNFVLPEPQKDYPIKYVLDGQQRLTSLFTVFQNVIEPVRNNHNWLDIYFDFEADESIQDSYFIPLEKSEIDTERYFPMNAMFDSIKYRKATSKIKDEYIEVIDKVQEKFKEFMLPVQEIETEDKGKVAIVFERINRAGTELDTFQLITAWTWSSEFDLQEEIEALVDELDEFGFGNISNDKDLLLKCCSGVILGEASPQAIMKLKGEEVRKNFNRIRNGIKGAIDFLQTELKIESYSIIPYPSMLVSLTRYFTTEKINGLHYTNKQRKELIRWFWRSCYSRRYTSGVTAKHKQDLKAMDLLRENENHVISDFECKINNMFFLENGFNLGSVNSKTFIITLANKGPLSFISGSEVNLKHVLKTASRNEFHHFFPRAFLKKRGKSNKEINKLTNICILNSADNRKIRDKEPKKYKNLMPDDILDEILDSHLCPGNTFELDFEQFQNERNKILIQYAEELIK